MNEKTIWSERQNHPELVVMDLKQEFGLNETQCKFVRETLMRRGVNKWLYCRLQFIQLKHEVKEMLEAEKDGSRLKFLHRINAKMQNIAKTPRWVEWGTHIHKKMKNNIAEIKVKGRHC